MIKSKVLISTKMNTDRFIQILTLIGLAIVYLPAFFIVENLGKKWADALKELGF
jgi:hypothetical protein